MQSNLSFSLNYFPFKQKGWVQYLVKQNLIAPPLAGSKVQHQNGKSELSSRSDSGSSCFVTLEKMFFLTSAFSLVEWENQGKQCLCPGSPRSKISSLFPPHIKLSSLPNYLLFLFPVVFSFTQVYFITQYFTILSLE